MCAWHWVKSQTTANNAEIQFRVVSSLVEHPYLNITTRTNVKDNKGKKGKIEIERFARGGVEKVAE